jgi:hypothetical protein
VGNFTIAGSGELTINTNKDHIIVSGELTAGPITLNVHEGVQAGYAIEITAELTVVGIPANTGGAITIGSSVPDGGVVANGNMQTGGDITLAVAGTVTVTEGNTVTLSAPTAAVL